MSPYPWHQASWTNICAALQQEQLTHAWLILGSAGTGRSQFVSSLGQRILCESPVGDVACGQCQSCQWFAAQTHPDNLWLCPEEAGKAIKVDQVRALIETLALAPHGRRGRRVVIISPAEAMNRQAANSLLKSLEEPPAETYFFLIASELSALPATIRSRCQLLKLASPGREQAQSWLTEHYEDSTNAAVALEITNNAPLRAMQLLETGGVDAYQQLCREFLLVARQPGSPTVLADQWLKQEQHMPINWLLHWTSRLIKLKQTGKVESQAAFDAAAVAQIIQQVSLKQLFAFYDAVLETGRLWSAPLNRRLQLEGLFSKWLALFQ